MVIEVSHNDVVGVGMLVIGVNLRACGQRSSFSQVGGAGRTNVELFLI